MWVEARPDDSAIRLVWCINLQRSRGRENDVRDRVEDFGIKCLPQYLAVVHHGCGGRGRAYYPHPMQHAPFRVEETVALAESDPLLVDGAGSGHEKVYMSDLVTEVATSPFPGSSPHPIDSRRESQ